MSGRREESADDGGCRAQEVAETCPEARGEENKGARNGRRGGGEQREASILRFRVRGMRGKPARASRHSRGLLPRSGLRRLFRWALFHSATLPRTRIASREDHLGSRSNDDEGRAASPAMRNYRGRRSEKERERERERERAISDVYLIRCDVVYAAATARPYNA